MDRINVRLMTNTGFGMWRLCVIWLIYNIWGVTPQVIERLGCFIDNDSFILTGVIYRHRSNMTVDWCLNECLIQRGDVFAGLEAGYACLCGNDTDHTKYGPQRPDSECWQSPCPGNVNQTCGGPRRLDIYRDYNECSQHNGGCGMACINTPLSYYCDCHNAPETEECSCRDGFASVDGGEMLQCTAVADVNECIDDQDPCSMDNSQCINTSGLYRCECTPGYILKQGTCSDVNECIEVPDQCSMDNFECINTPGSYQCVCKPGYTLNQGSCSDIDECSLLEYQCNQNCINTDGAYVCSCMTGYELVGEELYNCSDQDECVYMNTCDQVCTNLPGGYECSCYDGYRPADEQGTNCKDVDECSEGSHHCNQTCINTPGLYQCICEIGYHTCPDVQDRDLLEQIAGLEKLTTGLIIGLVVLSLTLATCLVVLLCVCLRLKRDHKPIIHTSASIQDSSTDAPCYENVANNNLPEGSANYEELSEFHLKDSTYQTITPSDETS